MRTRFTVPLCGLLLAGAAHAADLTVVTHDSFDVDKKLVAAFEKANGVKVRLVKAGDAGAMLSRLILTKAAPIGDVVYGLDNTLVGRAKAEGILEPYRSPLARNVPARLRIDDGTLLNTVDYGYVTLNYDKAWFASHKLALPRTLDDLTKPAYRGLLVVQNPTTSSPGLAFMLATVRALGPEKAWTWWKAMREGGMKVTRGWSDAYYTDFTRAGGKYPIVVSYGTSPAAEVFYSEKKLGTSPTANLALPGASFLQLEGVGILKGTKQPALARKFVDFMLSPEVQADFPTRMWVYPAREGVKLAPVFAQAQVPNNVATFTPAEITRDVKAWTDTWTKVVLR
ncbi:thiamine ABC transporter substrate-binding protein [Deinococcus pimensis]|uniref:thiamine ABC transporter substrate-binding protein n=1 Tax=Deinococcus pimensis TaxID=309888 RepID=UPI000482C4E4|nr:thiamine ABC transporter substrate-binding protein [Deinococcus pimensis]